MLLESTELLSVGSTNPRCLRVLRSQRKGKPEKVVVGDRRGTVTCLKYRKQSATKEGGTEVVFEQKRESCPVTALTVDSDRVVVCFGSALEVFKKKGRQLRRVQLDTTEPIESVAVARGRHWLSAGRLHQCVAVDSKATEELAFFMCEAQITDTLALALRFGADALCAVSSRDSSIGILKGSKLLCTFATQSVATCLCQLPQRATSGSSQHSEANECVVVYGCEDGSIGAVRIQAIGDSLKCSALWRFAEEALAAVSCICAHRFGGQKWQQPCVVVGRIGGLFDVFAPDKESSAVHRALSGNVHETITAVDCGFVTAVASDDIVAATFSGRVVAVHIDADAHFSAWHSRATAKLRGHVSVELGSAKLTTSGLKREIEELKRQIATQKRLYQSQTREMIAAKKQFEVRQKMRLEKQKGAYIWTLEADSELQTVAMHSTVELEVLYPANGAAKHSQNGFDYVFEVNATSFELRFRAFEGSHGEVTAFVISANVPKACRILRQPLKCLSLHSVVSRDVSQLETAAWNSLQIAGEFTAKCMQSWLSACLCQVPSASASQLCFESAVVGSLLCAELMDGVVAFRSQSLTALCILNEWLTSKAVDECVTLSSVRLNPNRDAMRTSLDLISPTLRKYRTLFHEHSLIQALTEVATHQSQHTSFLSAKYLRILENAKEIKRQFEAAPKHLRFLEWLLWSEIANYCRIAHVKVSAEDSEQMHRALKKCDVEAMRFLIDKLMH